MTAAPAPAALAACMKNEGIFLVEWLAFHRVVGFAEIVVCTNDCEDGSDTLLDRLADAGAVTHLRNIVPPGGRPQASGIALAMAHLARSEAEWLAHFDSDEFLNIGLGQGRVPDLIAQAGGGDVIALPWRLFGDNGHADLPGDTLPSFTACQGPMDPEEVSFKSVFRFRRFGSASDHMPGTPLVPDPQVRSALGAPLQNRQLYLDHRIRFRPTEVAHQPQAACLNHYATRSRDVFLMKNDRGRGWGLERNNKYHIGSHWHRFANRNEAQDDSILRHWPATRAEMARLRALPGIAEAEARCRDWFAARKAAILTPETIAAWTAPRERRRA